jgi:hypothetical protein
MLMVWMRSRVLYKMKYRNAKHTLVLANVSSTTLCPASFRTVLEKRAVTITASASILP